MPLRLLTSSRLDLGGWTRGDAAGREQVMDLKSMRLWALRVMGSLPLRCRCAFVVVKDSICVFPCDASGRLDLRQTFVLRSHAAPPSCLLPPSRPPVALQLYLCASTARAAIASMSRRQAQGELSAGLTTHGAARDCSSADEDRVYSQGCYVELEVPLASHCRCEVVHHLCFIFPHDGEHNYEVVSWPPEPLIVAPPPPPSAGQLASRSEVCRPLSALTPARFCCMPLPDIKGRRQWQISSACVLDTQVMTLRVCGHELASAEALEARQRLAGSSSSGPVADGSLAHPDEGAKYHFEVCGSMMACFPHSRSLECMLHKAWIAHVAASGASIDGPSALSLPASSRGDVFFWHLTARQQDLMAWRSSATRRGKQPQPPSPLLRRHKGSALQAAGVPEV